MPHVFLSYSSKDRPAAERVQQALSARGIDVFWDQETPPGQDWDTWIRSKLTACKVAVVLWSRTSVKSDNVRHEALVARKAKKLLPAMIDVIEAEDLPMGLYMVQTINLVDWRNVDSSGIAKLAEAIDGQLGRKPAAKAATATPTSGSVSPKAQTTLALVAIAAVVAAGAWFMMQQKPADPVSPPAAQGEVIAEASTTPGPTCLDGSVPTLGVCANGAGAIPPAPVLGGEPASMVQDMLGHWNWQGIPCASGPHVTQEGGLLVFRTPENVYNHDIQSQSATEVRTMVQSCTGCDQRDFGDAYSFTFIPSATGPKDILIVHVLNKDLTYNWQRCSLQN